MKKMPLIQRKLVPVAHEFEGSLPRIATVQEIAKIASCLLEALIFQRLFELGRRSVRYHKIHYSPMGC
jgi:hypothetical protein